MRNLIGAFCIALAAGCGTESTSESDASVDTVLDRTGLDSAQDTSADALNEESAEAGSDGGADAGGCGTARPTLSGIQGTEGLIVARDGTVYFSGIGGVGRMSPSGTVDPSWIGLTNATSVWGLALNADNSRLYVGAPSTETVYVVDLTLPNPAATILYADAGGPNGLAIGPDGALYYSDFFGDRVYRLDLSATPVTRSAVTTSAIDGANGLLFLPDNTLLVASYGDGTLISLTLSSGAEISRRTFAQTLGAPDGLARDENGRIFVTDNSGGRLLRLEADGTGRMSVRNGLTSPAAIDFGAGPLNCQDLYIATGAAAQRYEHSARGGDVLWQ